MNAAFVAWLIAAVAFTLALAEQPILRWLERRRDADVEAVMRAVEHGDDGSIDGTTVAYGCTATLALVGVLTGIAEHNWDSAFWAAVAAFQTVGLLIWWRRDEPFRQIKRDVESDLARRHAADDGSLPAGVAWALAIEAGLALVVVAAARGLM